LDLGAKKDVLNVAGEMPADIAKRWKREKIEKLLKP
jgi:hypothetical protein